MLQTASFLWCLSSQKDLVRSVLMITLELLSSNWVSPEPAMRFSGACSSIFMHVSEGSVISVQY